MSTTNEHPSGNGRPQDALRAAGRDVVDAVFSRRGFLRTTGVAAGAAVAGGAVAPPGFAAPPGLPVSPDSAASPDFAGSPVPGTSPFTPIRPPAIPLAVRSPYVSTWLDADTLAGTWPRIWFGAITAMAGLARIDGTTYVFMGAPALPNSYPLPTLRQTSFTLTPTSSRFTLEQGGVELTLTFLSPVEPGDLKRQSIPLSYVSVSARSTDRRSHDVSVYMDVSGEWAMPDHADTPITWSEEAVGGQQLVTLKYQRRDQNPLNAGSPDDDAQWGSVVWSAPAAAGTTWQIGQDAVVRSQFATKGVLDGTVDPAFRTIGDRWPVFAHSVALGSVNGPTAPFVMSIGHVHTPAIAYLGTPLQPLWTKYFGSWQDMVSFFHADAPAARARSAALDRRITGDAQRAGGTQYAALCALSLRQAYAATELVVAPDGTTPWAFLKEISSDGNVSTIDVMYPAMPVWSYLDPQYLGLLLAPIFDYVEHHAYPKPFAPHDLGSNYPQASGHLDGTGEEDMPVEESANMLIMSAAYMRRAGGATASAFAKQHYTILKQWADYLVANALDPVNQNQTDDFTGFIQFSVNLALKGIVGIGAMSQVAAAAGNTADAARYLATAQSYIAQWRTKSQDASAPHLKLAYDQPGTWSLKYNGFSDKLLRLGLVPASVADEEAAWYLSRANTYGVPLDIRHTYTKGDWEMWTAAWLSDHKAIHDALISELYQYANTTPTREPFSDLYDTVDDTGTGFRARPVVGGVFALLAV